MLACLVFLAGCSGFGRQIFSSTPHADKSPALKTNLYGDFSGWKPVGFSAKPFASLVQHSFCEEGGDYDPDCSADGKWLVFSSMRHAPNPDIYIKTTNGSTATRLTSDPASEIQPSFSPTGDKVAYASNRSGSWNIWVVSVDGSNPVQLTSGTGNDIHPSWSPDAKNIVYCSLGSRSGQWELWVVNVENPAVKKWIGYGLFPEWSPNPKVPKIAFQLARYRGSQWFSVWTVDYIDGQAKYPTEIISNVKHACICPTWFEDGSMLAYSTVSRSNYENTETEVPDSTGEGVWIIDLDGRNSLRMTMSDASNFAPVCSPDNRIFFCSDRGNGIDNIWSVKPHRIDFKREKPVDLSNHPLNIIKAN